MDALFEVLLMIAVLCAILAPLAYLADNLNRKD